MEKNIEWLVKHGYTNVYTDEGGLYDVYQKDTTFSISTVMERHLGFYIMIYIPRREEVKVCWGALFAGGLELSTNKMESAEDCAEFLLNEILHTTNSLKEAAEKMKNE